VGLRPADLPGLDQYANVRPTRILPGITSPLRNVGPGDLRLGDGVKTAEGEYAGCGGRYIRPPEEVGTEVAIFPRRVQRIMRYAFTLAQSRPRKFLTVVTNRTRQRHGIVMWDEIADEVSKNSQMSPGTKMLVDAMTVRMTLSRRASIPSSDNLHADILSTSPARWPAASAVAPTANIDPERRFQSMFEPIHARHSISPARACQSGREFLDRIADARSPRRSGCLGAADARRGKVTAPASRRRCRRHRGRRRMSPEAVVERP